MSFIFGIIHLDKKSVSLDEIQALGDGVKWKNFQVHTETDRHLALGYCHHPQRQSKGGIYKNEKVIVVADIRIYNSGELKKSFDYDSPEEAFAKAYLAWGPACANHISGDFAVAVIDRIKDEVHLFRDHIGARPLTWTCNGNRLIFASHEFGLVQSGLIEASLSEEKLICRFFRFHRSYAQTAFNQVQKVEPGHSVSCSFGQIKITKYWKPENIKKDKTLSFADAVFQLRQLLVLATTSRIEPGKTGVHVSGGLDSTGIASIIADTIANKTRLTGYSWSPERFDGTIDGTDEKKFIEAFSLEKGVPVKYLDLPANETVKNAIIPEFETQHIEHPVMQMAEKDGIETLFSGWGGDEFVSLSLRGTVNHLFFSFKWLSFLKYIRKKGFRSTIFQIRTEVLPLLVPFGLMSPYRFGYTDWTILRLFKAQFIREHGKQIFFHRRKNIFGYGSRTRFMLNLMELHHLPERMDTWAIHAERYGFDYKYPLLDKNLLEFWFSIPVEYTYQNFHPRLLYREALKGILTESIRTRKDKGEGFRIAYTLQEQLLGKKYLAELFYALPRQDHLPFFRTKAFTKVINQPVFKETIRNVLEINKLIYYLRYVALVKKYIK